MLIVTSFFLVVGLHLDCTCFVLTVFCWWLLDVWFWLHFVWNWRCAESVSLTHDRVCLMFNDVQFQVPPAAPTVRRTLQLLHPVLEAAMLVVQGTKLRHVLHGKTRFYSCKRLQELIDGRFWIGRLWSNQIEDDSNIPQEEWHEDSWTPPDQWYTLG